MKAMRHIFRNAQAGLYHIYNNGNAEEQHSIVR
jgi:hypothetical protein